MEYRYYWNDLARQMAFFSNPSARVLEVGCGKGRLIGTISGARKTGIDRNPQALEVAKKWFPGVQFLQMDAMDLQIAETYDLVILSNLIGELSDVQKAFEQLRKVCHPRTKIIITYYNYFWEPILKFGEWVGIRKRKPVQHWLSRKDIRNLLYLAGFETWRESSGMLLPVYIPLLSSFFNRFLARLPLFRSVCLNNFSFARMMPPATNHHSPTVSVIVPARNESGNIENLMRRLPMMGGSTEVIFVEGHSTDGTWEQILRVKALYENRMTVKAARQEGEGKNDAVKKGFAMATGDILMILDGDLTVAPEDLPRFYEALVQGKGDFINGNRLIYQMDRQAMRFLNLLGNKIFGMIFTWLLGQPIKDTLCGTKVMWRSDYLLLDANRHYFGNFDPFGDFDLLFGAFKLNLKISDMPVRYHDRTYGATNISRFSHGMLLFRMCWIGMRKIKFI